jgi:hypothetical protein
MYKNLERGELRKKNKKSLKMKKEEYRKKE